MEEKKKCPRQFCNLLNAINVFFSLFINLINIYKKEKEKNNITKLHL